MEPTTELCAGDTNLGYHASTKKKVDKTQDLWVLEESGEEVSSTDAEEEGEVGGLNLEDSDAEE